MLEVIVLSHLPATKKIQMAPSLTGFSKELANFEERQKTMDPMTIADYLLFQKEGQIVAYTFLEGAKDLKNMCATYTIDPNEPLETETEVIEQSVRYSFDVLDMYDVNFLVNNRKEAFINAGVNQDLDILMDNDMIVYMKNNQLELEHNKQY